MVWGDSLLKHRLLLGVSLIRQLIVVAGHDIPVSTQVILLGEAANIPWDVRLFPFVVIHHHHPGRHDGASHLPGRGENQQHLPRPAGQPGLPGRSSWLPKASLA